ncbi:uncharacterized protein BJ212DRAFT_1304634 [Suillus subaureus]|uniref:Uncharacterized protein n=1 Tax=Suillus subaureus TaxID=48587 RepID=A0A9P7DUA4_9AGAM|nr:uncharacterized protein BJ212DRAFT_1304634 [Suillus subaureus]KAG1803233.1 hypothetical protein BJ212DRAFT_1304634 [Suillus subaureus]
MAYTKNTAKKSNGGSVPHVLLKLSSTQISGVDRQRRKALTASKVTPVGGGDFEKRDAHHKALTTAKAGDLEKRSGHNEYCILCRDGADSYGDNTLFMCTLCPRVVCRLCLQLPPDIETKVLQEDVSFCSNKYNTVVHDACICCHIKMEPGSAYFGFYNANCLLVLDRFLPINGALKVSDPFEFAHAFLKPYYAGDGIKYLEVYYDIGTDAKLCPYHSKIWQIIKGLKNSFVWEHVIIGMSTHTNDNYGDPFTGYEDDNSKVYVSTPVNDFLEIILKPWQSIINSAQESYLWMLCCGSLVTNLDSFHGLQEAVVW